VFFFSSRRRHTRFSRDWSSDVCSSDLSFSLLYVPKHGSTIEHVCATLTRVSTAIEAMFTLYGFGAKTSSGSGTARSYLKDGKLRSEERRVGKGWRGSEAPEQARKDALA